jgi:hypothetical protein
MSDDFDITLKHKLESNRDGADGGVSEARRIELVTGGGRRRRVERRQGAHRDGEPEAGGPRALRPQVQLALALDGHLPLYRQSQILATPRRRNRALDACLGVGAGAAELQPLHDHHLVDRLKASARLFCDDNS